MIQNELHIRDYIHVIMRRRWVIIAFFTVLVTAVLIGTLKQRPIYEAATTIRIEHSSPRVVSVQEVTPMGTGGSAYRDYYETQYKLITSRSLMKKVSASLGLALYDYNPAKGRFTEKNSLLTSLKVKPVRNSQLVQISVEGSNPEMTKRIADTIANEYIAQNLKKNITAADRAGEWITKKIIEQRKRLIDAEYNLRNYRKKHNINVLPQMGGGNGGGVEGEYSRLQALFANYNERYTDEHPRMIELKAQIASLRSKIYGLEDVDMDDKTMEYRVMEKDVQTNKHMYESLLSRLKEIDVSSTLDVNNISVIDTAEVPEKPIKPNMKRNMLLAIIVGLFGGIGLGFFVDYLDTTIKSPYDVRNVLESYFLGSIPDILEKDELKKDKIVHLKPRSPVSEAYRDVRTEILQLIPGDSSKTILIASAEPKAGKTITAANLSIAFSQKGNKVLLVDCDLRKPQIHKIFGLDRRYGLSEYLKGDMTLDLIVRDTKIENLSVVTSGNMPNDPAEIIGSKKMDEFIRDAKEKFDFVLFDSSPTASVTDAVVLASMTDALIQVIRSGKLLVPIALRAKEKLNTRARYLGVVLNDLKAYYDNSSSYKYYRYYGEEIKKRSAKK